MDGIQGRVAIVTGAGRGIGQGVALRLAEEGASVVANDLDQAQLDETVRQIEEMGGRAAGVVGSVSDSALSDRLAATALERFGDLHIVVAAAGYTWDGMAHRMSDEQWRAIIDVHLTGTFLVVRDAFKVMRERARQALDRDERPIARHMVTISSKSAFGNLGQANYSAAKAGIVGLTRTMALEGAMFNVLANSVAFGVIDTRDIVYFASITGFFVFLTIRAVETRRWR